MNDVLIRGTPQRKWFVDGYLIPALLEAGVPEKKIHLYMDTKRLGNLGSFLALEDVLPKIESKSVWHLQDDVYPVSNFAERCEELEEICPDGIIFGFAPRNQRAIPEGQPGHISGFGMRSNKDWQLWSFQCIMIPTANAIDGIKWIREKGEKKCFPKSACGDLQSLYDQNIGDDSLFFTYLENVLPDEMHYDCEWSLVDHVGGMIGGSLLGNRIGRAMKFADKARVDAFEDEWNEIARGKVLDYLEKLGVDRAKVKF
jgi:hypothetical protein